MVVLVGCGAREGTSDTAAGGSVEIAVTSIAAGVTSPSVASSRPPDPTASAVAGIGVGLHDLRSSVTWFDPRRIAVLDADGAATACVQGRPGAVSTTVP
jgi:hypothetical protein